jgi:hypothetical protein
MVKIDNYSVQSNFVMVPLGALDKPLEEVKIQIGEGKFLSIIPKQLMFGCEPDIKQVKDFEFIVEWSSRNECTGIRINNFSIREPIIIDGLEITLLFDVYDHFVKISYQIWRWI